MTTDKKMIAKDPVFQTDSFQAIPLELSDEPAVQAFLEACQDFHRLVHGEAVPPGEGLELLTDLPPGGRPEDKFVFGVYDASGQMVALLDLARNYPTERAWWIGLLLIRPEQRGRGLGQAILPALEGWLREQGAECIGLGVVAENTAASRFWERAGFEWIAERSPRRFGQKEQAILVYNRPLKPRE